MVVCLWAGREWGLGGGEVVWGEDDLERFEEGRTGLEVLWLGVRCHVTMRYNSLLPCFTILAKLYSI